MSGSAPDPSPAPGEPRREAKEAAPSPEVMPLDPSSGKPILEGETREIIAVSTASFHLGPLPPPETLREYEDLVPGSAREIMEMAKTNMSRHHERTKLGQYGSIGIACLAVIGGCSAAAYSGTWSVGIPALLIAAIGVGGPVVAKAFVERFPRTSGTAASNKAGEN